MALCTFTQCGTFFTVTDAYHLVTKLLDVYILDYLTQYTDQFDPEQRKSVMVPDKHYCVHDKQTGTYRFHINNMTDIVHYLQNNGIRPESIEHKTLVLPEVPKVNTKITDKKTPRENQLPAIEFLLDKNKPIRLVGTEMGFGKTYVACYALHHHDERTLIVLKPKYIDKWIEDLYENMNATPDDILVVRGGAMLKQVIELGLSNGLSGVKYIIVSNKTMQMYIKDYLKSKEAFALMGYGCYPDQFAQTLGIGTYLVDEVHEDYHMNFIIMLFIAVKQYIFLSGTLSHNNAFIEQMLLLGFPKSNRYIDTNYSRHTSVYPIIYSFKRPDKIKTTEGMRTTYSQYAFEKSIIKQPVVLNNYLTMVGDLMEEFYLKHYQPGDKIGIYAALIDMCNLVVDYLKKRFPDKSVARFTKGDPFSNLMDPDVRVSTIGKFGTAMDVPGLTCVINTISVDAFSANLQVPGRLRRIPGRKVYYVYTYCGQLEKHKKYDRRRRMLLMPRVKRIREKNYQYLI